MLNRSIIRKFIAAGLVFGALLVAGVVVLPHQSADADDPDRVIQALASDLYIEMYHDAALTETRDIFDEVHFADYTVTQPVDQNVDDENYTLAYSSDVSDTLFDQVHNAVITVTMPVR